MALASLRAVAGSMPWQAKPCSSSASVLLFLKLGRYLTMDGGADLGGSLAGWARVSLSVGLARLSAAEGGG